MKKATTLTDAAREVERARAQLATARRKLARHSRVGTSPTAVLSGDWQRADRILAKRRDSLRAHPGVVGVGLGHRHRSGFERQEICIVVFVEKKLSKADLRKANVKPLPARVSVNGEQIAVDVVELGTRDPHGPGDVIASIGNNDTTAPTAGTIGAAAIDLTTNEPVLLTAMHVAENQNEMTVPSKLDSLSVSNGTVTGGFTTGVDAAKVVMTNMSAVAPFLPPGLVAGWRPISNDVNTVVRMYGRTSHGQSGVVKFLNVDVYDLESTLIVDIGSQKGDSGAAILDNSNLILGFLYGRAPSNIGDFRVFCPASLVLSRLGCDIKPN